MDGSSDRQSEVDVEKAYVYATPPTGHEILVFEHTEHDAGVQIPKGTIDEGEHPRDAAIRELQEECGVDAVRTASPLSTDEWFYEKRRRLFRRHFFHVETTERRDQWRHEVTGGGEDDGFVFECYWAPVDDVSLVADMDDYLELLPLEG